MSLRTLVISRRFPGRGSGAALRLDNTLHALAEHGPVELLWLAHAGEPDAAPPASLDRLWRADWPSARLSALAQLLWAALGREPIELFRKDFATLGARFLRRRADAGLGAPDLLWCYGPFHGELVRAFGGAPVVTDLYDLLDRVILGAWEAGVGRAGLHDRLTIWRDRLNASRWARHQRRLARASAVATVCSQADRDRLGCARAVVLPNVYALDGPPLGRERVGEPPTILFQGSMVYAANVDGARFLVEEIAPRIWARLPEARLLLAGRADERVARLAQPGRVEVSGWVERIETVLARADLVAVPLRLGSGTRLKILEAFAHGIPVVSTPLGAEGLELEAGRHALITRDPDAFAAACSELLGDLTLRRRVIAAGRQLHAERYSLPALRRAVGEVVERALGSIRSVDAQTRGG